MHTLAWTEITPENQKVLGELCVPGKVYLAEDDVVGSYMHTYSHSIEVHRWDKPSHLEPDFKYTNEKILVMRAGGIGDVLFLTPAIHAFKTRYPETEIILASMLQCPQVMINNPDVAGYLPYPCPVDRLPDLVISPEHLIEFDPRGRTTHVVDLYAEACFGVKLRDDEKGLRLFLDAEETKASKAALPKPAKGKLRIGVQGQANLPVRSWPGTQVLVQRLAAAGHQVVVFNTPYQPPLPFHGVINTNQQKPPLNLRQCISMVPHLDVMVAPDSAFCHIAGALDVPCVALYGSFPSKLRTAYQPKTFVLEAEGPCAPCFHHGRSTYFPPGCPSAMKGICQVLGSIAVDTVFTRAIDWAKEWKA